MAKSTLLVVLIIAALACAISADRSLAQQKPGNKPGAKKGAGAKVRTAQAGIYNCGGVWQIGSSAVDNKCCALCYCLGQQSPNKVFASASLQKICNTRCAVCVSDAQKCKTANDALPQSCVSGLQFSNAVKDLVNKCAAMYQDNPSSVENVPGC